MQTIDPDTLGPPDRIKLLEEGLDVGPLRQALLDHPYLWNERTGRTASPESPHREVDDIWCRFAPEGSGGALEHSSVWYPPADALPVRDMARMLMAWTGGEQIGGVLITRIPAGSQVYPHVDQGWHAGFYDKFAVQVAAAPKQTFRFVDQELVTLPGDLFWFDNSHSHWVTNDSDSDRITAIFCIRLDRRAK